MTYRLKHDHFYHSYQHLPKIARSEILLLWADFWGQGPLSGIALFRGVKHLYELNGYRTTIHGQPMMRYLLSQLTLQQQRYFNWWRWYGHLCALDAVPEVDPYDTLLWLNPGQCPSREELQGILPARDEVYEAWLRVEASTLHEYEALLRVDNRSLAEHISTENINEEKALIQQLAEIKSVSLDVADEAIVGWFEQPPMTLPDEGDA